MIDQEVREYILKPELTKKRSRITPVSTLISLALFVLLFYLLGISIEIVIGLTAIVFIHELGHYIAMKSYGYKNVNMLFIPLFGAFVSGYKEKTIARQEIISYFAGPVPGIIFGMILIFPDLDLGINPVYQYQIGLGFIALNVLNLLPFFPLDGGRIIEKLFDTGTQKITVILLGITLLGISYLTLSQGFTSISIIGLFLVIQLAQLIRNIRLKKKLIAADLTIYKSYEELTEEEYLKIRGFVLEQYPDLAKKKEKNIAAQINEFLFPDPAVPLNLKQKIVFFLAWLFFLITPIALFWHYYGERFLYLIN